MGYDSHHVIKALAASLEKGNTTTKDLKVTAKSLEKFLSLRIGSVELKDSCQLLNSSLDKLVNNLKEKGMQENKTLSETFPITYNYFKKKWAHLDENLFEMLTKKGIYPYEYMDDWEKFKETKLPDKKEFFSKLYNKHITDEEYQFAQSMMAGFRLRNLGELHDLYVEVDTVLLSDVFENFRDTCLSKYKLDPAQFMTAPGLSWSACLKKTRVELELLTDVDMNLFIDKGLIGGVSAILNPYAKANNKKCPDYDENKPTSWIKYLDANNLYGWAMMEFLPTGGFEWMDISQIEDWKDFILKQKEDQDEGYFLEVDLDYPNELHDTHDNFPCAPEKFKIEEKYLSYHQRALGQKCGVKYGGEKLCLTLKPKEKYILHYRNLKQYLENGLRLTNVHRVLKFKQSPWLKEYIEMNTNFRKEASNKFDINFFKLMNNSFYGKTCEDTRK